MTEHINLAELRRRTPGSRRAHEALVEAVRRRFELARIVAIPIYTGGIPMFLGGKLTLTKNPRQAGVPDMIAFVHDSEHPSGTIALLEMKTGKAHRSPAQNELRDIARAHGVPCYLIRQQEDVEPIIQADRHYRRKR